MAKRIFLSATLILGILLGSSVLSSAQTPPPSPTLNSATAGNRQVTLGWTSAATANGYNVKYGTSPGTYPNSIDAGNATSFIVNSLTNNTAYYFVVTAYNAGGESGPSNELSAQPFSVTAVYSSDLCNGGTSSASSCLQGCSSGYSHTSAFDNVFNVWDGWVANGVPTGWLQYTFSSPETITKYTINPRGAVAGNPRNWTFEAYNTASSQWVVLDTRVNQTWTYQISNEYTAGNTNAYTQYRLNISANGGHNEVGLTEMEMMRVVTPGAPAAITDLQSQATNASVTLTWSEPSNGGSPITSYQVQYGTVASGAFHSTYIDDNVPGATINGLANNTIYQFRVVAVNALSNSDPSNTVTGTPTNGTTVSGPITANATWTLAPTPPNNGSPYIVTGDITINPGVTLTIQPGVEVKFAGNFKITVNGTLSAAGTSSQNIRFTSSQATPAPGDWKSITINGPTGNGSILDYVTVEYGGNTDGANIYLEQSSPTITNSTIAYSSDFAVTCSSFTGGGCYPTFNNNTYTNNAKNSIRYFGDIYHSGTLRKAGAPYVVTGDILIKDYTSTVIWTIDAGVEMRFDAGKRINVGYPPSNQNGGLTVQGTVSEPVIFTSNQPSGTQTPGYWAGINLVRGPMTIDHAQIEYADSGVSVTSGSASFGAPTIQNSLIQNNNNGIYFYASTAPNILNSTITNNGRGIYAECNLPSSCSPTINFNSISGNTNYNLETYSNFGNASATTINALNNWWGTTNLSQIENSIFHFADDPTRAHVNFVPYLDAPGGNPFYPPPAVPQLTAATGVYHGVHLTWDAASYATGYKIFYGTSSGNYTSNIDVGNVLEYTVPGLTPGIPYYFVVAAYNPQNQGANSNELSTTPNSTVLITDNTVTDRFIDPKRSQTTMIQYTLNVAATVTIEIYDRQNQTLVRTLISNQPRPAGANFEVFDGKNDQAQNLDPDIYVYKITASDGIGGNGSYDPPFTAGPGTPLLNVNVTPSGNFSPFAGERLEVGYLLSEPALISLALQGQTNFMSRQPRDTGNHVDFWDGRDGSGHIVASPSQQNIEAATERLPENFIAIQDEATLDVELLTTDPYLIRPLYNESTKISYTINEPADVTVTILTEGGSQILLTLELAVPKSAGTYFLTWDGKTANGETVAEDGHFRVRVKAVDSFGHTVTRDGSIKVLF